MKLNRRITEEDLKYKGFPFECENCGNHPTPKEVIENSGACKICGDSIIAYTVDTAEFILQNALQPAHPADPVMCPVCNTLNMLNGKCIKCDPQI